MNQPDQQRTVLASAGAVRVESDPFYGLVIRGPLTTASVDGEGVFAPSPTPLDVPGPVRH